MQPKKLFSLCLTLLVGLNPGRRLVCRKNAIIVAHPHPDGGRLLGQPGSRRCRKGVRERSLHRQAGAQDGVRRDHHRCAAKHRD